VVTNAINPHRKQTHENGFVDLTLVCNECWSKGRGVVEVWEDFTDPGIKVTLYNLEAYVDFSLNISAKQVITTDLFWVDSQIGAKGEGFFVGIVPILDVVFTIEAELDITTGFWVTLPEEVVFDIDLTSLDAEKQVK
jgi:hypothetical protein